MELIISRIMGLMEGTVLFCAYGGNTKIDPDFRFAIIDNVQDIEILKKYCYYEDANDSYPESEYVGDNFVRHIRLEYTVEWYN